MRARQGFTLIEISIVLVIIGLIIGGILVGRDMIKAAEVRATISQWEQYNAALNVFRSKYNGLPGDLANAANFGFTAALEGNGVVAGDGLLQSSNGTAETSTTLAGMETTLFWQDLSQASLIKENLNLAGGSTIPAWAPPFPTAKFFPSAKIGNSNSWLVFNSGGRNFYEITGIFDASGGPYQLVLKLTPLDALAIDSKVDDGLPDTGIVQAQTSASALNARTGVQWMACLTASTGGVYLTNNSTNANKSACQLRLDFN
jgi:prepilin-type N-terminal cleavage/methylation domain-containing protein